MQAARAGCVDTANMKLDAFLQKNKVKVTKGEYDFCVKGLEIMKNSHDPLHDNKHVERMFSSLDEFINLGKEVKKEDINFSVILIAICWHDTWKASRFSKNPIKILVEQAIEGVKAARLTRKAAKDMKTKVKKEVLKGACYCIAKHSNPQLRRGVTLESRLLRDADLLEVYSDVRIRLAKNEVTKNGGIKFLLTKTGRIARSKRLEKGRGYNFKWYKQEHQDNYPKFLSAMEDVFWKKKSSSLDG